MPARIHPVITQTHAVSFAGQPEDVFPIENERSAVAQHIRIEYTQTGDRHTINVTIDAESDTGGGLFTWHRTTRELGDAPMWLKMEIGRHQPRWCKARIPGQQ